MDGKRVSLIFPLLSVIALIAVMAWAMVYGNTQNWPDWLMCTVWNVLGMALIACSIWVIYARWKRNNGTAEG